MKLTLKASCNFDTPYSPRRHGDEPHEPGVVQVHLRPNPTQKAPYLRLEYRTIFDESTHTVKDIVHHQRFVTRTVAQKLPLKEALWVWSEVEPPEEGQWPYKDQPTFVWNAKALPSEWLHSLGLGEVQVDATFDRREYLTSALDEWIKCASRVLSDLIFILEEAPA